MVNLKNCTSNQAHEEELVYTLHSKNTVVVAFFALKISFFSRVQAWPSSETCGV
jgi:hypothetical protein